MVVICPICGKRGYLIRNSKNSFRIKHYRYELDSKWEIRVGERNPSPYHTKYKPKELNGKYCKKFDDYCTDIPLEWALKQWNEQHLPRE
jgi:hypothetical protein